MLGDLTRGIHRILRAAGRFIFWPVLWFTDRQVRWIDARLAQRVEELEGRIGRRLDELDARVGTGAAETSFTSILDKRLADVAELQHEAMRLSEAAAAEVGFQRQFLTPLSNLEHRLLMEADIAVEMRAAHGRALARLDERLTARNGFDASLPGWLDTQERALRQVEERLVAIRDLDAHVTHLAESTGVTLAAHGELLTALADQVQMQGRQIADLAAHGDLLTALADQVQMQGRQIVDLAAHGQLLTALADQVQMQSRQLTDLAAHGELLTVLADQSNAQSRHLSELGLKLADLAKVTTHRTADLAAKTLVDGTLANLGEGGAEFLNYATGYRGFSAQAGVWFNPPVLVQHRRGRVELVGVNERIVEVPYVLEAVADLPAGSHVLDFGATESTLALSLASMGHDVVAVDLRPYPLEHPRLTKVTRPVEEWEGPKRPFDAIISLSTLEHVGLGHYGDCRSPHLGLDHVILKRFRGWLRPGGLLVLTAPYGRWSVDDLQRTYDAKHLNALLRCWEVLDRRYAVSPDPLRWFVVHDDPLADGTRDMATRGVVMLKATPTA